MTKQPSRRTRRRRYAVLGVLAGHQPMPVADICGLIGCWGSVRRDLEVFEAQGFVVSYRTDTRYGPRRYYRLADQPEGGDQ